MGLRINTNVQSLLSQHRLAKSKEEMEQTQQKMASGSRIIRAMDDAAGLAISEGLKSFVRTAGQNIKNAQNGFFLLQTADGSLSEMTNIVIRMRELAVESSSDTNGDKERIHLNSEYQSLKLELNRISATTVFNGRPLLTGQGGIVEIQVGPNNNPEADRVLVAANFEVNLNTLGLEGFGIDSADNARNTLEPTTDALDKIAQVRGSIGAAEARLQTTLNNLGVTEENLTGSYSVIRDADMAIETSNYVKNQILQQAGVSILSQANAAPRLALKLLE